MLAHRLFLAAAVLGVAASGCMRSEVPARTAASVPSAAEAPAPSPGARPVTHLFAPLPYAYDALEPYIDARTMEIHYDRHHRGYFQNFLAAIKGTNFAYLKLEELFALPGELPAPIRNNGGGFFNHELFWQVMSPKGGGAPQGELAKKIDEAFGSLEAFKAAFEKAAMTRFGSGWAWLCVDEAGKLFITSSANQDNPLMSSAERRGRPILGLDVWEHAYYLKYQNQRASYAKAFWNVVNWPAVDERLARSRSASR